MKNKIVLALGAFCLILGACGGNDSNSTSSQVENTASSPAAPAKSEGEILIAQADCIGCHHKENKVIGPSYMEVAAKYENTPENVALLAKHIIEGSKGIWGTIPMTPHPKTTTDEAKKMVTYIMSLKP